MTTKSKSARKNNPWEEILTPATHKEKIELDTQMLAFKFLSIVEKCQDIRKISRKELAKRINTSPSYITQLFRGDKIPNLEILVRMSKAMNFDFQISVSTNESILEEFKEDELLNTMKKARSERVRMVLKNTPAISAEIYNKSAILCPINNEEYQDESKAIPA
ncbi:helix-turn-helix domain-containing protein [Chitinophaga tropicalis]|uniref:Helix-turn-helix domain-containing protein n=1 Tax=Chitinophaga tropicalis TaxID=2683588 RepID=A0A7K1TZ02_9BACT|nr:helix-turn-helix domain-containing protein [Chitinophaga tropicalis]MVT07339.1 helix-turn-helix domain-containing protein [Chitinophaga tropicalis]